jgi:hypothetical protein
MDLASQSTTPHNTLPQKGALVWRQRDDSNNKHTFSRPWAQNCVRWPKLWRVTHSGCNTREAM